MAIEAVYFEKSFKETLEQLSSQERSLIFDAIRRTLKEFPYIHSTKKLSRGGSKLKILRRRVSDNPDLRLLFQLLTLNARRSLLVWDVVKGHKYGPVLERILAKHGQPLRYEEMSDLLDEDEETLDAERELEESERDKSSEAHEGDWHYRWDVPSDLDRLLGTEEEFRRQFESLLEHPILTFEQLDAVTEPHPLLLQGTSGTGKTLILLLRLSDVLEKHPDAKAVYLALFPGVAREIRRLYLPRIPNLASCDFLGLSELLLGLVETYADPRRFPKDRRVDYTRFVEEWYRPRQGEFRFSPESLWEEIRGLLRGKKTEDLSRAEYVDGLGKKESRFPPQEREAVLKTYRNYLDWKSRNGYWDDADLAQECWRILERHKPRLYDAVAVDEVQDLTARELLVLTRLAGPDRVPILSFAGDVNQKLFPSSFRWAYVNDVLRASLRHPVDKRALELDRNFRSRPDIVALGNFFLARIRELQKEQDLKHDAYTYQVRPEERPQERGRAFFNRFVSADELDRFVRLIPEAPGQVLLYPTEELKCPDKIQAFSVAEFKGLENDRVIIIGMFRWAEDRRPQDWLKDIHILQRFYVAVTRAVKEVWFLDSLEPPEELRPLVAEGDLWNFDPQAEHPAEDWERQAIYYELRERMPAARGCFLHAAQGYEQGGDRAKALLCYTKAEAWQEVVRLLLEDRQHHEAAKVYETRLQDLDRAREHYAKADAWPDYARVCEKKGDFAEAARVYERLGELDKAARNHERNGNWREAVRLHERTGSYADIGRIAEHHLNHLAVAARAYQKAGDQAGYARVCEKRGLHLEAGRIYEKLRRYDAALAAFEKASSWRDALRIRVLKKDYVGAAAILETRLQLPDKARVLYEKAQAWEDAIRLCEKTRNPLAAGRIYERHLNRPEEARSCYAKAKAWQDYARISEQLGDFAAAAAAYERIRNYRSALRNYEQAGLWEDAVRMSKRIPDYAKAAAIYEHRLGDPEAAKFYYEQAKDWPNLARLCEQSGEHLLAGQAHERSQNYPEALAAYEKAEAWEDALRICEHHTHDYAKAAAICEHRLEDLPKAKTFYARAGDNANLARVCELLGDFLEAGRAYERIRRTPEAISAYEKAQAWEDALRLCETTKDHLRAGRILENHLKNPVAAELEYEKAQAWEDALRVCGRTKDFATAGRIYEKHLKDYANAREAYAKAKSWTAYARVCELLGDFLEAGQAHERSLNYPAAQKAYEKARAWEDAVRICEQHTHDYAKAAAICEHHLEDLPKAKELYGRIGDWSRLARVCEALGEFREAGQAYEQMRQYEAAARNYEKAAAWDALLRVLEEHTHDYAKAAAVCEHRLKDLAKAQTLYEKAQDWLSLARIAEQRQDHLAAGRAYERLGQYETASSHYEKAEAWEDAARTAGRGGDHAKAAAIYERIQNYHQAKYCYAQADDWKNYTRLCEQTKDYLEAARTYEKHLRDYAAAAANYKRAQAWPDFFRVCEKTGDYAAIAHICEHNLGDYTKAKDLYAKAGAWDRYAQLCERLKQFAKAAKAYERIQDYTSAARNYLKAGADQDLKRVCRLAGIPETQIIQDILAAAAAAPQKERLDLLGAAKICESQGDLEEAKKNYKRAQAWPDFFRLCEMTGDYAAIAHICEHNLGDYAKAQRYYEKAGDMEGYLRILRRMGSKKA